MVTFLPILTCTATSAPEEHPHGFHPIGTLLSLQSGTLCSKAVCATPKFNTQGWEDSSVGRVLAMQTQGSSSSPEPMHGGTCHFGTNGDRQLPGDCLPTSQAQSASSR